MKNTANILSNDIIQNSGEIPYLCASAENNAISTYTEYDRKFLEKGNCIFIGGKTFVVTYQEKDFFSNDSHNLVLYLKEGNQTESVFFYMASCIYKALCKKYSWGNSISKTKIQDDVIMLPITEGGAIDFPFMESFIAEMEAYLKVSGLSDYELTAEEKQALEAYQNDKIPLKEYTFSEIFNHIKQGRRLKKDDQIPGDIPFVMSGVTNMGVVGYVANPVASFPKNSITVDIFGNSFYRNYDFGAGDDTGVYWNDKILYAKLSMLYFTASIEKSLTGQFSYGNKLRSSQSLNFKIKLPTKNESPDCSTMDLIISAVQKLVIKNVVLYADQKIQATEQVITKKLL